MVAVIKCDTSPDSVVVWVMRIKVRFTGYCNKGPNFAYWPSEKGIPVERRGRKTTDLRDFESYDSGATEVIGKRRFITMRGRQPWQPACKSTVFKSISYELNATHSRLAR